MTRTVNPLSRSILSCIAVATALSAGPVLAVDKAATGTELTDPASWGGTAPAATGVNNPSNAGAGAARWTLTSLTGAQTVAGPVTWDVIHFNIGTPLSITGSPITLAGANTGGSYDVIADGGTTSAGMRSIANDLVLTGVNSATPIAVGALGSRLQLVAGGGGNLTLGNVTSNGGANANDANLFLRGAGSGNVVNGTLTVDGQLGKGDTGTWTLNGNNSVGWVFTNNGTLLAGSDGAFGTGTLYIGSGGGNVTVASSSATARTFTNPLDFTGGTGFNGTATFGQTTGGTGTITFSAGVNLGAATRTISTAAPTTFSGVVAGSGGLTKDGSQKLTLSGANTYTGVTTIRGNDVNGVSGTRFVEVASIGDGGVAGNLGAASNAATNLVFGVSGASAGQLNYIGTGESTDRLFTVNGHAVIVNNGTGPLNFTNTGAIGHAGTVAHTLTLAGSNTGSNTFAPLIEDGGTGAINVTKSGAGTWILTGANTYTGVTRTVGGVLAAASDDVFGTSQFRFDGGTIASSDATPRTFTTTKTIDFALASTFGTATTGNLLFTDLVNVGSGAKTFTVNNAVTEFSGTISGGAGSVNALTKAGPGLLILSGANTTDTRPINVNDGTLHINGSTVSSGIVTINNGGTLGGTGTIAGAIVGNAGGTLAPGAGVESLHTGGVTLNADSTFASELDSTAVPATGADLLVSSGSLLLAGNVKLTLSDVSAAPVPFALGTTISLINYGGAALTGMDGSVAGFSFGGGSILADGAIFTAGLNMWQIDYDASAGGLNFAADSTQANFVNITAVPEPASAALLLGGIGFAFARRRRRSA